MYTLEIPMVIFTLVLLNKSLKDFSSDLERVGLWEILHDAQVDSFEDIF